MTMRHLTGPWLLSAAAALLALASPVEAQTPPRGPATVTRAPAPRATTAFRGFFDVGMTAFAAAESFEAVLGSPTGVLFGGGGEVVLPQRIVVGLRVSRFQKRGERVFVHNGEVFGLGIDSTIAITPIEVTGGYKFGSTASMARPYIGGGVGWHRYEETSDFAEDGEDVSMTKTGFHLLGGVEFRVVRWAGAAIEGQWTSVPDAIGQEPNSASAEFGETDLGGASLRVKFVIGGF